MVRQIRVNRTGSLGGDSSYRQYLGYLCFPRAVQRLSELLGWMGAFGLSGYTGNHIAIDPDLGVTMCSGNRCHNRVSTIEPAETPGAGAGPRARGRLRGLTAGRSDQLSIPVSKGWLLHQPVYRELRRRGWLRAGQGED